MKKKISNLIDLFEKICLEICCILLVFIFLSIVYQVIIRKLGYSVTWVDESTRYAMISLVFIGTVSIARRGTHIRIVSFIDMFPAHIRKITELLTYGLVTVVMLLFSYCCLYASHSVGDVRFSMLTFLNMKDFYLFLFVTGLIISLMVLVHIVELIMGDHPAEQGTTDKEKPHD